ncbi:MAG: peptidyl-alpha-hydroxyglycine alpha-amidating lyase family protein [Gemmatimonadota bacterium]
MLRTMRAGVVMTAVGLSLAAGVAPAHAQNSFPNPYRTVPDVWAALPDGRSWGATSAVAVSPDGETIWAVDRCGANACPAEFTAHIVFQFDKEGRILRQWGGGMIEWPHGIDVDQQGNVWIADARGANGRGHQVIKFSPDGEVLLRLGTAGVAGRTETTLDQPNDVLVAPNGNIFVADGHPSSGNNRIVKYAPDGTYLMEWGETGAEEGQFRTPHALAMDDEGLLYVGDRSNRRVQVFDQDGNFIRDYLHLGRASGLAIWNGRLYVADSESDSESNPGFKRGIRVMDIATSQVLEFIPDPELNQDEAGTTAAEGVAVDNEGNVYGAEVGPRALRKHVRP